MSRCEKTMFCKDARRSEEGCGKMFGCLVISFSHHSKPV
jgi:hypothetical protein